MAGHNPTILRWARETAGLDVKEAAKKVHLRDARGLSGADRLAAIEAGEVEPSLPLLRRMAQQYRRPLLTFYLKDIPSAADVGEDFRTLPTKADPANVLLSALLRDVKSRQILVKDILQDDDDFKELQFVGSVTASASAPAIAEKISTATQFDIERFRDASSVEAAFDYTRSLVENLGIFVILAGNLGSWQTALEPTVFRGFALADRVAPFVVINDQDAKSAWSFTLFHELAHIWLGSTGVSGSSSSVGLEQLCNDVAAELLLPTGEIPQIDLTSVKNNAEIGAIITQFASTRNISRSMVAYKLFRSARIDERQWLSLAESFRKEWLAIREKQRELNREKEGGPNYYVVRRHRLGTALVDLVRREMALGSVTPTRAAKILGVKPMSVYPLVAA